MLPLCAEHAFSDHVDYDATRREGPGASSDDIGVLPVAELVQLVMARASGGASRGTQYAPGAAGYENEDHIGDFTSELKLSLELIRADAYFQRQIAPALEDFGSAVPLFSAVNEEVKRLVSADSASLWLIHADKPHHLWTCMELDLKRQEGELGSTRAVHMRWGRGIEGACLARRETLHVSNCYANTKRKTFGGNGRRSVVRKQRRKESSVFLGGGLSPETSYDASKAFEPGIDQQVARAREPV